MILPDDFVFSRGSLQDFVDCPRRFYLRYIQKLHSAAPESEPLRDFERHAQRSAQFHHLVRQHQSGIPVNALEGTIPNDSVGIWWDNYRAHAPADLPEQRHPEMTLSVPLGGRRLAARCDLLAIAPGERAVIVDWNTALVRPTRDWLARRMQTSVYPYVLARAGAYLNGGQPVAPESISLIYWFAEFPDQPEIFNYSAEQFRRDGDSLSALATDILRRSEDEFELTDNTELCRFCAYRSLNGRGVKAGNLLETSGEDPAERFDIDLHVDQIAEAGF